MMFSNIKNIYLKKKSFIQTLGVVFIAVFVAVKYHSTYEPALWRAFATLIQAALIIAAYNFSKDVSVDTKSTFPVVYAKAILICAAVGLFSWGTLGTHVEDADPLYGGGEIVTDYEPTDQERNETGWHTFVILLVPTLMGVHKGLETRRFKELAKSNKN